MKKIVIITKEGRALWTGPAQDHLEAVQKYRTEIGTEALDYDAVNPNWADDLEFDFSEVT